MKIWGEGSPEHNWKRDTGRLSTKSGHDALLKIGEVIYASRIFLMISSTVSLYLVSCFMFFATWLVA